MKVNRDNFNDLSMDEKGKILFSKGSYIAVRDYYNYKVQLYGLKGFYVEVWYHPKMNNIDKIEALNDEKSLNLYLSDIEILDLLR
jgi:hypothetical protein